MKRGTLKSEAPHPQRQGSEALRMAQPLLAGFGLILRTYHWPLLILTLLYLGSGSTVVKPGQVALVLRLGRLVGETPAEQIHRPGFLFAWPRPLDEIVRVDVESVRSLEIDDLTYNPTGGRSVATFARRDTIDPEVDGYFLTGDRNVLQARILARYRVRDPIAWTFEQAQPEAALRDAILAAMVRTAGEMSVDAVLKSEGRTALPRLALERAQLECDRHRLGVELLALELPELRPPQQVQDAFSGVIDAAITAITVIEEARRYQATEVPGAKAEARRILSDARSTAEARTARARGEADAFRSLLAQAEKEGPLLRERLYRESLERALARVTLRLLPPPPDGKRYSDFRITVPF